jgi:hypothetical protein
MKLIGFICKNGHGYINCEELGYPYCPHCDKTMKKETFTGGRTEYSTGLGMNVNSKDIDRICKERGLVVGGADLTREAARNKAYNEARIKETFNNGLQRELRECL